MPNRGRQYLRKQRKKHIKRRVDKIYNTEPRWSYQYMHGDIIDNPLGKFSKGHYGYLGMGGRSVKTNTRKGHCPYRCKGAYGPADNYKPHDKRQIIDGEEQVREFYAST